jgi:hypothetical protein
MLSTSRHLLPPNHVNGPPNVAANHFSDDEASMDTAMNGPIYPGAVGGDALSFAGTAFTSNFAAFSLNGSNG